MTLQQNNERLSMQAFLLASMPDFCDETLIGILQRPNMPQELTDAAIEELRARAAKAADAIADFEDDIPVTAKDIPGMENTINLMHGIFKGFGG